MVKLRKLARVSMCSTSGHTSECRARYSSRLSGRTRITMPCRCMCFASREGGTAAPATAIEQSEFLRRCHLEKVFDADEVHGHTKSGAVGVVRRNRVEYRAV